MTLITGNATVAAVIGHPIGHSLSPVLHGYWLQQHGINGAYVPLDVAPEAVEYWLSLLPQSGFAGANVTIPYKEAAFRAADEHDAAASTMGAVNTLLCRDGRLVGMNSDAFGFVENLDEQVPDWRQKTHSAMVLGAGGAARAVIYALLEAGISTIWLANRTLARAESLAEAMGEAVQPIEWRHKADRIKTVDLLVNTTSLGMDGQPALDLSLEAMPSHAVVADIVYQPLETKLLQQAKKEGLRAVTGLGMLIHQGRLGFRHWFGIDPYLPEQRAPLERQLQEHMSA